MTTFSELEQYLIENLDEYIEEIVRIPAVRRILERDITSAAKLIEIMKNR